MITYLKIYLWLFDVKQKKNSSGKCAPEPVGLDFLHETESWKTNKQKSYKSFQLIPINIEFNIS